MLIQGVRDFSIHGAKKTASTIILVRTVVAAIIPEGGLAPSLYRTKIEREQLEHLNTVNKMGIVKKCAFFSFYYNTIVR